jgi:1,4-dihydroxy-6-naphthoate synthase
MTHIRIACSPDADDLFMMRALIEGLIDTGSYTFEVDTSPTDDLNRLATEEGPEVLALSIAHYPHVAEHYQLLPHGGSMGEGYGPVVVASETLTLDDLRGKRVGVPGLSTTAWAVLRMMIEVEPVVTPIKPYALIFEALRDDRIDAGLIIHEGRLTFKEEGFQALADLGVWWSESTSGLPLPLGANSIRRDLEYHVIEEVSDILRRSIAHALDHRKDAIEWLIEKGSALKTPESVSTYLDMYANQRTLDYGADGRTAVEVFLEQGSALGLFPEVTVDWAP